MTTTDPWAPLRRLLEDWRRTGSVDLTAVVAAALPLATAEQHAAALQARPDVAVDVVGRLRVASEWKRRPIMTGDRPHEIWERGAPNGLGLLSASVERRGQRWPWLAWTHPNCQSAGYGAEDTREAAMAAADAALVAAGWSLAGSRVEVR